MNEDGNVETPYFGAGEPAEQKKERQEEKAKTQGGRQLLLDLIKRWEKRIAFYDSIDSLPAEVRGEPKDFIRAVQANEQTKANLQLELDYLTSLKETYLDKN